MRKYRKPYKERVMLQYVVKFITDVFVIACLAYFIAITFFDRFYVVGNSMNDELKNDDLLLVDKATYEFADPNRFDIIIFESTGANMGKVYAKRVVGLPGEKIQIKDGTIFINGMVLVNDVVDTEILVGGLASDGITLGEDEFFVLGDNRNNSEDSRFYTIGNVKRENIIGKPWITVYPFADFGFVE